MNGKINSKDDLRDERRSTPGSAASPVRAPDTVLVTSKTPPFEALAMVETLGQKHNLTLIEISLRWVMHHSALNVANNGGDGILIGVSSHAQLQSNLKDLDKGRLPDEVVKVLDDAWRHTKAVAPPYWHGTLQYTYDAQAALFGK